MTSIRLPRLLDANLQETARLHPLRLSVDLRLDPLSTAEMVLPASSPWVSPRDLIELYDENGSLGVYRVKTMEIDVQHTRTLKLEHSFATLQDGVIAAQGFMDSVSGTITRLLSQQPVPLWTLGDVEAPADLTIIFATEYVNLLEALETLLGMLPEGYALDFDQTVTPWKLHLRRLSSLPFCEGRLSRNLHSVRYTQDGSRLCTRVYPFGAEVEEGRLNLMPLLGVPYLESSHVEALGVISRTFNTDLVFDVPSLQSVAEEYLARHRLPEITVTVDGVDLSAATGESLDAFRLGRSCRLALPEDDLLLTHQIIAIHKPDVYGAPGQVTLTLSNRLKRQSEKAEIEEIVRQVTAGKLIGGKVTEFTDSNRAHGSVTSPIVHYFTIEDWAAVLDVRISFDPDSGVSMQNVRVDSAHPPDEEWRGGSFSAMPYLRRDALGCIAQGEHWVAFSPTNGTYGQNCGVNSTVTLTVIEKTTT